MEISTKKTKSVTIAKERVQYKLEVVGKTIEHT